MKKILIPLFLCLSLSVTAQNFGFVSDGNSIRTIKGEVQVHADVSIEKCDEILKLAYLNIFPNSELIPTKDDGRIIIHSTYNFTLRPFPVPYSENLLYNIIFTLEGSGKYSYVIESPSIQVISIAGDKKRTVAALLEEHKMLSDRLRAIEQDDTLSKKDKKKQIHNNRNDMEDIEDLLTKSYDELMTNLDTFAHQL